MTSFVIDHSKKPSEETGADGEPSVALYAPRTKIFPQMVQGRFRRIKTGLLIATLGIYYFLPFLRWDRGPHAPDQAVLLDLPNNRFYFFFIEIWPQEVYYITGLLILAALVLFLMNAIGGRVWCGYLCPQTVWTDLFLMVERLFEGDRRQRMLLDEAPWTANKIARRALKHSTWILIAWWTGGAWVLYFADAPTLVTQLATFTAPMTAWMWIGGLTATTYLLAGHMREQVCTYMCPWPRIQAALIDEHALTVTYRADRGEPRYSLKKAEALRAAGEPAGDCIDCHACLNACPTGVDIREGNQLACINCGLCIDACDSVMAKVGRAQSLIAYDNDINIKRRRQGLADVHRLLRPRTLIYFTLIALVGAVMITALGTRQPTQLNVLHDRNPIYVRLSDGSIRNAYTVRVLNKQREPVAYAVSVEGVPGASVEIAGSDSRSADGRPLVTVGPDQSQELRLLVTAHGSLAHAAHLPITVRVEAEDGTKAAEANDFFRGP